MNRKDIYNFKFNELEKFILKINEPKFRAKQIFNWLYKKGACDFEEMKLYQYMEDF